MEKLRILIVDDEAIQAMDTAGMVRELGHEVVGMAYTYGQAVEMTQRFCPDLVLMDINLGELGHSGIDAVASLRNGTCAFRVIYITAYADERTIKQAVATVPLGYLVKPFRQSELLALLLLAKQQMTRRDTLTKIHELAFECGYSKEEASIICSDRIIPLTKTEQKFVELLIDAGGSVVPFETIEYEVWPEKSISDGAKRTLIYRINQKVGEKLIQNVQGIGCRILLK